MERKILQADVFILLTGVEEENVWTCVEGRVPCLVPSERGLRLIIRLVRPPSGRLLVVVYSHTDSHILGGGEGPTVPAQ